MEPLGLQDALGGSEPGAVEFVIGVGASGFVPIAFVDGDHFAGVAGDAAVERKYGGSAKTRSTEFSGMAARISRQSPW